MPELDRLSVATDWIKLEFLVREATPEAAMKKGIQLHLVGVVVGYRPRVGLSECPEASCVPPSMYKG